MTWPSSATSDDHNRNLGGDPGLSWLHVQPLVDGYDWQIAALPHRVDSGARPVPQLIWGTSDRDIHVPCFGGSIYHWDGTYWAELPTAQGPDWGFNAIHGNRPDNIYAVGDQGIIVRFDGVTWTRVPGPRDAAPTEAYTGVRVLDDDRVVVCGRGGSILSGGRAGFDMLGGYGVAFYGVTTVDQRIILAAGDACAWELTGTDAGSIRTGGALAGAFDGGDDMALFAEPVQTPHPALIDFSPSAAQPWARRTFPAQT